MNKAELRELQHRAARIRGLSLRSTAQAGSGHPTSCLSVADILAVLLFRVMRIHPDNPRDPANDRLVLSKGHAAPALYAAWVELGYLAEKEFYTLRQLGSRVQGHPMPTLPFVDVATGSLGQGLSVGLGLALAQRRIHHSEARTFVVLGDGEMAEGSVWEAMALAAYEKVDNLVAIVDANRLGQSRATMAGHDLVSIAKKVEAFGLEAFIVEGHDLQELDRTFKMAAKVRGKPACILARTTKGHGVAGIDNLEGWHGRPLKPGKQLDDALAEVERNLMAAPPAPVVQRPATRVTLDHKRGPVEPPSYQPKDKVAPRAAFGDALVAIGKARTDVIALDADTKNSTFAEAFFKAFPDRAIDCFIAEQNMVGVAAGLASQGLVPVVSTFGAFLSRAFDQIRMAALSGLHLKLVGTHSGISIGEDGPSQMALEDLAALRTLPNGVVLYPADGVSSYACTLALMNHPGPGYLRLSRPALPLLYPRDAVFPLGELKVPHPHEKPLLTVIANGVILHEVLEAVDKLGARAPVQVVDLYCLKPFPTAPLAQLIRTTRGNLLVAEEHYAEGGVGEAVATNMAGTIQNFTHIAVRKIPGSGSPEALLTAHGLDRESLARAIKAALPTS